MSVKTVAEILTVPVPVPEEEVVRNTFGVCLELSYMIYYENCAHFHTVLIRNQSLILRSGFRLYFHAWCYMI